MKYLYSGGCSGLDIPETDVLEVLAAASFFQLLPLQRHCEARAAKSVDLHNLVSVYIHAKVLVVVLNENYDVSIFWREHRFKIFSL